MKTKLTLFVTVLASVLFGTGCASSSLNKGLVAYYPFNGNAKDESGNGNHGTFWKGARLAADANGITDQAVAFDGIDDQMNFPYPVPLEHNFSFSFLARPDSTISILRETNRGTAGISGNGGLISYGSGEGTGKAGIGVNLGSNGISIVEHADFHIPATLVHTANLSGWKQYTIVVKESRVNLYINGVFERQGLQSTKTLFWAAKIGKILKHPGGSRDSESGLGRAGYGAYKGEVDEFRVYNRALSATEVKALYDLEKPKGK